MGWFGGLVHCHRNPHRNPTVIPDWFGYGDADETPDWEAARAGVAEAAGLFAEGVSGGGEAG